MKVSVIVPAYNEEKTIAQILKKIVDAKLPAGFQKEIIVVDDASSDNTGRILSSSQFKLKTMSHSVNLGKGAAILTGLSKATGDLVLIQDADLEYDPSDYVRLLAPFKNKKVRVVYGSRLINYPLKLFGKHKTPMPIHLLANKFLTLFTNVLYGHSVTDMETGYKVFRRDLIASLNLRSKRFDFEPEITAKLLKKNINIIEVPIKVKPRSYAQGKKIGWKDGIVAVWILVRIKFFDS